MYKLTLSYCNISIIFWSLLLVAGGVRNINDNKVSGPLSNSSNHHVRLSSDEEYINIAHKLENEVNQIIKIPQTKR